MVDLLQDVLVTAVCDQIGIATLVLAQQADYIKGFAIEGHLFHKHNLLFRYN